MESPPTKAKQREGSLGTLLAPCLINRGLYALLCKWLPDTAKRWLETMYFVAVFSTPCRPFFGDVVKTLLGLNNLTRGAPSVNQRATGSGSQRGSSSGCFSNGYVLKLFSSLKSIQKSVYVGQILDPWLNDIRGKHETSAAQMVNSNWWNK